MTKHYAVGVNIKAGTIKMKGRRVVKVPFKGKFETHPAITLTLEDRGSAYVPYRTKVKLTGFRIVFDVPYNGTIGWTAIENA